MAWHSGKPADTDLLSQSVQHIRENFAELEPIQPHVDALVDTAALAPHVDALVDTAALAPHVDALLDSRIVEMGSNINGQYVRWENGLQVCFASLTTSVSEDTLWTLPAAFIDNTWTFCSGVAASFGAGAQVITFQGRTASSIMLRVLNASGARVSGTAFIIAIGRWK